MSIKHLEWDSNFFKIKIGLLHSDKDIHLETENFDLIYVSGNYPVNLSSPFKNSFSNTKRVYQKQILNYTEVDSTNIKSFSKKHHSITQIQKIAYESGKYSRFKLDPNFSLDEFQRMYNQWIENSILKKNAKDLWVYEESEIIKGIISFDVDDNITKIGLLGVLPQFQGQGIGNKLLKSVENWCFSQKITELQIPTQSENKPACIFYDSKGYKSIFEQKISHYWKK